MRRINYIIALLTSIFFISCEKEEFIVNDNDNAWDGKEFYINPEDTAGIVVPEGYSLVIFPGSHTMTRATNETRITHLQYLIYQKEGNEWIQYLDNRKINQDFSSWPIKAIALSVPKGKEYRVVFLGNVDRSVFGSNQTEEVLTGTGEGTNYSAARIILPRVEFSDRNMYYHAMADFNTNEENVPVVNILLKRIVSRNDITKEALSADYTDGVTNDATYKAAYWKQIIKENMKGCIFTDANSTFSSQVAEGLKRYLIYPLIYCGLVELSDATGLIATGSYPAVAKFMEEWDYGYKPEQIYLDALLKYRNYDINSGYITKEYANNLYIRHAEYLYGVFIGNRDAVTHSKALTEIFNNNIKITEKDDNGVTSWPNSIDAAIEKTITAFSKNYTSGVLLPWRFMTGSPYSVVNINTRIPIAIDFNLENQEYEENPGNKYYQLKSNADNTKDKYISIITLGDINTSSNKLGITSISSAASGGTNIDYAAVAGNTFVNDAFTAGGFQRNIKSVSTEKIESISFINPQSTISGDSYKQRINVNMYNVLKNSLNLQSATNQISVGSDTYYYTINKELIQEKDLINLQNDIIGMFMDNEYYVTEKVYPFVTFICPDVSPENINVTTSWVTTQEN